MHFDANAERGEERDGQLAPQMLTEVGEALHDFRAAPTVLPFQAWMEDLEAEMFEQADDTLILPRWKQPRQHGIAGIERDADGDRLAMIDVVAGDRLKLVRGPVAVVQRTG